MATSEEAGAKVAVAAVAEDTEGLVLLYLQQLPPQEALPSRCLSGHSYKNSMRLVSLVWAWLLLQLQLQPSQQLQQPTDKPCQHRQPLGTPYRCVAWSAACLL